MNKEKHILNRTIIYNENLVDVTNLMTYGYKYFSKIKLICYWCERDIITAAYSKSKDQGYFKTLPKQEHELGCKWGKTKIITTKPQNPKKVADKLFMYMSRKKRNIGTKKHLVVSASDNPPSSKRLTTMLNYGKKIELNERSDWTFKGRINYVSNDPKYPFCFVSLFRDNINLNVRIKINAKQEMPVAGRTYMIACIFGLSIPTFSRINPGIDIDVEGENFFFKEVFDEF